MSLTRRSFLGLLGLLPAAQALRLPSALAVETSSDPIPKRVFGRYPNEKLSVIGFGGHTLALAPSVEEATSIAHYAIDQGVNFFDNCWEYHNGRAEEWMGQALSGGWRDKAFIMSKVCVHHGKKCDHPFTGSDKEIALQMLEQQLKRLKTDRIDLWMIHEIKDVDVEPAYAKGGVIEALVEAREKGLVRYVGFTGHDSPQAHVKMIEGGFPFDASLMPVSVLGNTLEAKKFDTVVMPLLKEKGIACIGMKGFGGSKRANLHGMVTINQVINFALSYPEVTTQCIGIDSMAFAQQAVAAARVTNPMTPEEREKFIVSIQARGGSDYAQHLQPGYHDGACCIS
jgi:aryl-alcohol dehydrogenase-like predicted oxidoreductase